jgi:hypothetical protein
MPFDQLPHASEVLGAMITPAVLISASGTLVLSTSNRLGRVVDRVRVLEVEAEKLSVPNGMSPEEADDKRELITDQLVRLVQRIKHLQTALTVLYAAIGMLVATSLAVGLSASLGWAFGWVPIGLGLCGALALFVASVLLVRETRLAVTATLLEMAYVRKVVARRTRRPPV